jgi:hypothetical protein
MEITSEIDPYTLRQFIIELKAALPFLVYGVTYGLVLLSTALITSRVVDRRWRRDPKKQTEVARNAIAWRDRKIARMNYLIERLESENAELRVNHKAALVMNSKVTEILGGMNGTGSQGEAYRETEKETGRSPASSNGAAARSANASKSSGANGNKAGLQQGPAKTKAG